MGACIHCIATYFSCFCFGCLVEQMTEYIWKYNNIIVVAKYVANV